MTTVTTEEVQKDFSKVLARLRQGETLLLEEEGKPVATLVPKSVAPARHNRPPHPRLGFLKGRGHVPLNWKELSREEIEKEFYGEE